MHLHHLAFRTDRVAALATFYTEMFGLAVVRDAMPRALWLGLGGNAVLMIEAREDGETAVAGNTLEFVAFAVDESARAEVARKARDRGCYDGETAFTVYVRDPDGRRVGVSTCDLATLFDGPAADLSAG